MGIVGHGGIIIAGLGGPPICICHIIAAILLCCCAGVLIGCIALGRRDEAASAGRGLPVSKAPAQGRPGRETVARQARAREVAARMDPSHPQRCSSVGPRPLPKHGQEGEEGTEKGKRHWMGGGGGQE